MSATDIIRRFEGCKLTAYKDPVGVLTIGVGHTGPDVEPGMTITRERADELLAADVAKFTTGVRKFVAVPVTQNQLDAMVSFAFNVGIGRFAGSTLLRKLNMADYGGAGKEFEKWIWAGGKVLPGLIARRKAEAELFNNGNNG